MPKINESSLEKSRNAQLPQWRESEKKEKAEELRKTSYMVKSKGLITKYSSGYRSIKLENQPKLRLTFPAKE
jgi:hypothetical protein